MSSNIQASSASNRQRNTKAKTKLVAVPNITLGPKGGIAIPVESNSAHLNHSTEPKSKDVEGADSSASKTRAAEKAAVQAAKRAFKEEIDNASKKSETSSESVTWEYDVYATPFIPLQLRTINYERPGSIVRTRSRHWIDYSTYIATFSGSSFLSERPAHVPGLEIKDPSNLLNARSYFHQLTALWELECAAKARENESNALYKVLLGRVQHSNHEPLWTMSVPGLRDDNPFLEKGDVLHLRQLWVDPSKNLVQMPMQVTDNFGHIRWEHRSWTGVEYEAIIASVNRKQEIVYLEAEGLAPFPAGDGSLLVVNAIIPMKYASLEAQRMSLVKISVELGKVLSTQIRAAWTAASEVEELPPSSRTDNNDWIFRMLFPDQEHGLVQTHLRKVPQRKLFDSAVNYEQAHAVNSICINDYGTLPYLISGPPGTGKTKTLVEIAMNLLNTTDVAHILICAPSEAAADTIAQRLGKYLKTKELLRLNRAKRADNEVPRDVLSYCYMEEDIFSLPPFAQLMAYNIVVTSCQDAAILADARLTNSDLWNVERNMISAFRPEEPMPTPKIHWGALLVDEAAQATEIDVLPAISVVCPPLAYPTNLQQPLLIMAGDENQLGPRTASRNPRFATSLFSRLFDRPLYKNHPLSRTNTKPSAGPPVLKKSMLPITYPPFTNLIRNYRSHPAILSVPSSLFYNDTLIPEAPTLISPLQQSPLWQGRKWPVLFLPHKAHDEIERDGGGWYNVSEANLACSIAKTLVYDSQVRQDDICIMAPFAAQVKLLRSLMQSKKYGEMWSVNIGPLEAFQGLERRVVILCTTRTRTRFLGADAKRSLGIVNQKRKMNVALTRAKEALFVIGNPEVLRQDEHWRQWLAFCWRNGLVEDSQKIWDGDGDGFGEQKIGVLEKALISKEESGAESKKKALGVGATTLEMSRDYEDWAESLREALDEESEDEDDEEDEPELDNGLESEGENGLEAEG